MIKRILVDGILIFLCFILQCTLFQSWQLAHVCPNLLLILTASYGFMRGRTEGLFVGFFCGILVDIFYGDLLGFYALVYMVIGYLNGFFQSVFYDEDLKLPMILITVSDLIFGLIVYIVMFLLRNRTHFFYYFMRVIMPELVYTIVATIVLYRIILFINQLLETGERRRMGRSVE